MTNEDLHNKEPRSSTKIESDIRQTRGRMDATLDELSDRKLAVELRPGLVGIAKRRRSWSWRGKGFLPDRRSACEGKSPIISVDRVWFG